MVFLVVGPLRGGGVTPGPLREKPFFLKAFYLFCSQSKIEGFLLKTTFRNIDTQVYTGSNSLRLVAPIVKKRESSVSAGWMGFNLWELWEDEKLPKSVFGYLKIKKKKKKKVPMTTKPGGGVKP